MRLPGGGGARAKHKGNSRFQYVIPLASASYSTVAELWYDSTRLDSE